MTWPLSGAWSAATIYPDVADILGALCRAYAERAFIIRNGSTSLLNITSVTRSGSTVTVVCGADHGLVTGDYVGIYDYDPTAYNSWIQQVTVTSSTQFTFSIAGAPSSPATGGTIRKLNATYKFTYDKDWNQKALPTASDFSGLPVYAPSDPPEITPTALGQAAGTGALHFPGIGLKAGNWFNISGASQTEYNHDFQVSALPALLSVTSITCNGTLVTVVTTGAHLLLTGDIVHVDAVTPTTWRGVHTITKVDQNTFTYPLAVAAATGSGGTVQDLSRVYFSMDAAAPITATGTIKVKTPANMIYHATWTGGATNRIRYYCKKHSFAVGQYIEVKCENTTYQGFSKYAPVVASVTDSYFEISHSGTLTTDLATCIFSGAFWATRPRGLRVILPELQNAIAQLVPAGVDTDNSQYFAEDASPYETPYTLANLLGDGSYGSAWLDPVEAAIDAIGPIVLQMREALDLLTVVAAAGNATGSESDPDYVVSSDYAPAAISDIGADISVSFAGLPHLLQDGDYALVTVANPASIPAGTGGYYGPVLISSANAFNFPEADFVSGSASGLNRFVPISTLESIWDNLVSGSPIMTSTSSSDFSRRLASKLVLVIDTLSTYRMTVKYSATRTFNIRLLPGNFITGKVVLKQDNNGTVSQAAYNVTDGDGDTYAVDATLGTTAGVVTQTKTSSFFASKTKVLVFTSETPGSHPFSSGISDYDTTVRRLYASGKVYHYAKRLIVGTDLSVG